MRSRVPPAAPRLPTLAEHSAELSVQWDVERNTGSPAEIGAGSGRIVWWVCPAGHSFDAAVNDRRRSPGCPVCSGRRCVTGINDLATVRPDIAAEWNSESSDELTPAMFTAGSNQKLGWRCSLGHSWVAEIASRTKKNHGCPVCAGTVVLVGFNDLASQHPALAVEWDGALNGELTASEVTVKSSVIAHWTCAANHTWQARVADRSNGHGCPVCSGQTTAEKIAAGVPHSGGCRRSARR